MLWQWFIDFVDDPEPIRVKMNKAAPETTMGLFLRGILRDCKSVCPLPLPPFSHLLSLAKSSFFPQLRPTLRLIRPLR